MGFSYSALSSLRFGTHYCPVLASTIQAFEDSSKFLKFYSISLSDEFKSLQCFFCCYFVLGFFGQWLHIRLLLFARLGIVGSYKK